MSILDTNPDLADFVRETLAPLLTSDLPHGEKLSLGNQMLDDAGFDRDRPSITHLMELLK